MKIFYKFNLTFIEFHLGLIQVPFQFVSLVLSGVLILNLFWNWLRDLFGVHLEVQL